jgi:hypothetical protein
MTPAERKAAVERFAALPEDERDAIMAAGKLCSCWSDDDGPHWDPQCPLHPSGVSLAAAMALMEHATDLAPGEPVYRAPGLDLERLKRGGFVEFDEDGNEVRP